MYTWFQDSAACHRKLAAHKFPMILTHTHTLSFTRETCKNIIRIKHFNQQISTMKQLILTCNQNIYIWTILKKVKVKFTLQLTFISIITIKMWQIEGSIKEKWPEIFNIISWQCESMCAFPVIFIDNLKTSYSELLQIMCSHIKI